MTAPGLLLSDDLIFTSRITGVARDLGLTVRAANGLGALLALASEESPACIILDLAFPGLDVVDLTGLLRSACRTRPRLVAYGPHVDADRLRAARQAGCDVVLPRSAFRRAVAVSTARMARRAACGKRPVNRWRQ